jgi:hypothetical protein
MVPGPPVWWIMALATFMEINFPDKDLGAMTYWEIGQMKASSIFPDATQFISRIINEEMEYLPQVHLNFWKTSQLFFWSCKYCSFWCDHFDQRTMEEHLIRLCPMVSDTRLNRVFLFHHKQIPSGRACLKEAVHDQSMNSLRFTA